MIQIEDAGASDHSVLRRAQRERSILLTADKDFGRMVIAQWQSASGIVLFRRSAGHPERAAARLLRVIDAHGERLHQRYVVVTPDRVRIRRISRSGDTCNPADF